MEGGGCPKYDDSTDRLREWDNDKGKRVKIYQTSFKQCPPIEIGQFLSALALMPCLKSWWIIVAFLKQLLKAKTQHLWTGSNRSHLENLSFRMSVALLWTTHFSAFRTFRGLGELRSKVNHVCFQGHWLQCSFVALKWSKSVFWQIQLSHHPCPTNSSNVSLPSWSRSRAANRLAIPSLKVEKSMHFEMELYEAKFNFELIEIKNKLANCSSWLD